MYGETDGYRQPAVEAAGRQQAFIMTCPCLHSNLHTTILHTRRTVYLLHFISRQDTITGADKILSVIYRGGISVDLMRAG